MFRSFRLPIPSKWTNSVFYLFTMNRPLSLPLSFYIYGVVFSRVCGFRLYFSSVYYYFFSFFDSFFFFYCVRRLSLFVVFHSFACAAVKFLSMVSLYCFIESWHQLTLTSMDSSSACMLISLWYYYYYFCCCYFYILKFE